MEILEPEWITCIERNLYIVKSFPSFPTRTCWKMTGPPGILILIKIAMISRIGHKQINPKNDAVRSKIHFASIVMTIIEKFYTRFFLPKQGR